MVLHDEPVTVDCIAMRDRSWGVRRPRRYDVVLDDPGDRVVPALDDDFAARRAKGAARLVKYLREEDRLGAAVAAAELAELSRVLGSGADALGPAREELCRRIREGTVDDGEVLEHCARHWARRTQVVGPSMGSLAERHLAPLP
jgi:cytochrome c1